MDDAYNRLYKKEQRTGELFGTFAFIGIIIACLGLLGLASFSVERRTKEIGIRKVLGASASRIAGLLTREFLLLVIIANVIAWPIAYFTMHLWLQNFAYRIPISIWVFILAVTAALGIAIITISTQTLRAALSNPVDSLRYE
jgi:putative ABC transport system permease protein